MVKDVVPRGETEDEINSSSLGDCMNEKENDTL